MKISYKSIYALKLVGWINKYICKSTFFTNSSTLISNGFNSSYTCSSNSNYSASSILCSINFICNFFCHDVKFRVHFMFINIFNFNWSKSSNTDMKGDVTNFYTLVLYFLKKFLCKVKTCCWCSS